MKELLSLEDSVLVFLHIRKTAGISLQKGIQDQYSGIFYGKSHSALNKKESIKKIAVSDLPNGSAIANHWTHDDFEYIKDLSLIHI